MQSGLRSTLNVDVGVSGYRDVASMLGEEGGDVREHVAIEPTPSVPKRVARQLCEHDLVDLHSQAAARAVFCVPGSHRRPS